MPDSWIDYANAVRVAAAEARLPRRPGIYAFFLGENTRLPKLFADDIASRTDPRLLYIGIASRNLWNRVWNQECQHKSPGTFFRSVGVMLGYISPAGGPNFKFSAPHRVEIIDWIGANLCVAWREASNEDIGDDERLLIARLQPLLNIQHNPSASAELRRLRALSQALPANRP